MPKPVAFKISRDQPIRSQADFSAAMQANAGSYGSFDVALRLYMDIVRSSDPKPRIKHPFITAVNNIARGSRTDPDGRLRAGRERFHAMLAAIVEDGNLEPGAFQSDEAYAHFLGLYSRTEFTISGETFVNHDDLRTFAGKALTRGLEYMANVIDPTLNQVEQAEQVEQVDQATDYASSLAHLRAKIPGMSDFHVANGKKAKIDDQKQEIRGLIANFNKGNNGEKLATKIKMGDADAIIFLVREHLKGNKEATAALLRLNRAHFDIHQNAKLEKRGLTLPSMDFIVNSADQNGSRMKYSDYEAVKGRLIKRRSEDFIIKSYNQAEKASNSPNRLHQMALAGNTYAMEFLVVSAILELNEQSLSILVQLAQSPKNHYTKHRAQEVIEKFVVAA